MCVCVMRVYVCLCRVRLCLCLGYRQAYLRVYDIYVPEPCHVCRVCLCLLGQHQQLFVEFLGFHAELTMLFGSYLVDSFLLSLHLWVCVYI